MSRLTAEQVFAALPPFCIDAFGVDEAECNFEIDDNFIVWLESLPFYEEIDLADILWRWNHEFGLEARLADFTEFLRAGIPEQELALDQWEHEVKPTLTFRKLAQWFAEHTSVPSFAPINIVGRDCGPAGAFYGIAATVEVLLPHARFAPDSAILDHIRGRKLDNVWSRLNLYGSQRLPSLHFPYARLGCAMVTIAVVSLAFGVMHAATFGQFDDLLVLAVGCVALLSFGLQTISAGDPLPAHIKTFRDLAYAMSDIMNEPGHSGISNGR